MACPDIPKAPTWEMRPPLEAIKLVPYRRLPAANKLKTNAAICQEPRYAANTTAKEDAMARNSLDE
jgi:hypothetical protein